MSGPQNLQVRHQEQILLRREELEAMSPLATPKSSTIEATSPAGAAGAETKPPPRSLECKGHDGGYKGDPETQMVAWIESNNEEFGWRLGGKSEGWCHPVRIVQRSGTAGVKNITVPPSRSHSAKPRSGNQRHAKVWGGR